MFSKDSESFAQICNYYTRKQDAIEKDTILKDNEIGSSALKNSGRDLKVPFCPLMNNIFIDCIIKKKKKL